MTQTSGSAAIEGSKSFWCAFDTNYVHKGHLQLMNLRPKSLGHSKIVLWTKGSDEATPEEAASGAVAAPRR